MASRATAGPYNRQDRRSAGGLSRRLRRHRQHGARGARHRNARRPSDQSFVQRCSAPMNCGTARQGQGRALCHRRSRRRLGVLTPADGKDLWRLMIHGDPDTDPDSIDPVAEVRRAIGSETPFEIVKFGHWIRRRVVADHYRAAGACCWRATPCMSRRRMAAEHRHRGRRRLGGSRRNRRIRLGRGPI